MSDVEIIETTDGSEFEVEVFEAVPIIPDEVPHLDHNKLNNREISDQHPMSAITGLEKEIEDIKALKTVESNKLGVANYYEWDGGAAYDTFGYFVSLVTHNSTIKVCDGGDIFGVTVGDAAFVGGQNQEIPRDNKYALVVTSGPVDVRCESDVEEGDYVICNGRGEAKKTTTDCGYKVIAINLEKTNQYGTTYATIALGVQACTTDALGKDLRALAGRVGVNEQNIVSAINVANQAYNKATEVVISNQTISEKVDTAVGKVDKMSTTVENMGDQVSKAQGDSARARAIAETAALSATAIKDEAMAMANDAASKVGELTKTLEPLTTWTDPETGNKGVSYLANYIDNGLATKTEIETVEDDLEHAKTAISKNAKSLQSLVISIDKYSVGEHSTADGLTLEQATNILEPDIIYVPTIHHKEEYSCVNGEETVKYEREFLPGYLYRWGELESGLYGWITVDRDYSKNKLNTSAPAVYFSSETPSVNGDFGYWYTNSDKPTEGYESYTLYKWDGDQWFAVATLAGNVNNRSMSQIRQTANEIALEVTNARGSAATIGVRITDTESEVASMAQWAKGKDENGNTLYNMAVVEQKATEDGSSVSLVVADVEGNKVLSGASIVLAQDGEIGSYISIDADRINFGGDDTEQMKFDAKNIDFTGDDFSIDADRINMTGTTTFLQPGDVGDNGTTVISGNRITTGMIQSKDYVYEDGSYTKDGFAIDLDNKTIRSTQFTIDDKGNAHFGGSLDASQITTGILESKEYEYTEGAYATSGTAINLDDGSIRSKNFAIDSYGNAHYNGKIAGTQIETTNLSSISANLGTIYSGEIKSPDYEERSIVIWGNENVEEGSEGLEYTLSDDETYYTVTGIGSCTDADIVIPSSHEGVSVVSVGDYAFNKCSSLKSVVIRKGITTIERFAFYGCSNLANITIPNSVISIGLGAFQDCISLESIIIPNSVGFIDSQTFYNCISLTSITIPDGITSIGYVAFANCSSLTNITIPNRVTSIGATSFKNCSSLTEIIIPKSVASIGANLFDNCSNLSIYCEAESQPEGWDESWNPDGRPVYYYSETAPTTEGNYWHYKDTEGFRISCGDEYLIDTQNFKVTPDGHVEASSGSFSGHVEASSGNIGNLKIQNGGLQYDTNEEKSFSLNSLGLILEKNTAKIQVGDLEMGYDAAEKNTIIKTSGHLIIRGANSTQLEFMKRTGNSSVSFDVTLHCDLYANSHLNYYKVWFTVESDQQLSYPFTLDFYYRKYKYKLLELDFVFEEEGYFPLTINTGEETSEVKEFTLGDNSRYAFLKKDGNWSDLIIGDYEGFYGTYSQVEASDNLYVTGNLLPSITSVDDGEGGGTGYNLGSGAENGTIWNTVYARNQTIQSSDREVKKDIEPLSDLHEQIFDALEPVSYKFKVNNNNRTHTGFIAQGVKSAVENAGLTTQDFAAYCEWEKDDGTIGCGLRYGEFIALCVNEIQKLKKRVAELENTTK